MRNWKTNSKMTQEQREIYVDSWNLEGLEQNILYWVKTKEMDDPRTQGYIGVGDRNRALNSMKECIKQEFGTEETLEVIKLAEGETRMVDYIEAWYRPDFGIGWNYLRGGGRGFGGGSSAITIREKNYNRLKDQKPYTDYERIG